jgi:hypothetical protein
VAKTLTLRNAFGTFICSLTRQEAMSLREQGKAEKIGKCTYRLIEPPTPSKSRESATQLTVHDTLTLAGLAFMAPEQRERLIGYGLIA